MHTQGSIEIHVASVQWRKQLIANDVLQRGSLKLADYLQFVAQLVPNVSVCVALGSRHHDEELYSQPQSEFSLVDYYQARKNLATMLFRGASSMLRRQDPSAIEQRVDLSNLARELLLAILRPLIASACYLHSACGKWTQW